MLSGLLNSADSPYNAGPSNGSQPTNGHASSSTQPKKRERSSSADSEIVALDYIPVSPSTHTVTLDERLFLSFTSSFPLQPSSILNIVLSIDSHGSVYDREIRATHG